MKSIIPIEELSPLKTSQLVGGPQDGARVTIGGGNLPGVVFVGPKWLGDGFAAWSREGSKRFPARYVRYYAYFKFDGWVT